MGGQAGRAREHWIARSGATLAARFGVRLVPAIVGGLAVILLLDGLDGGRLLAVAVIALVGALAGAWLWHLGRRTLDIVVNEATLSIGHRGTHALAPGSLHAARSASGSGPTVGSVIFVRLDAGDVVPLVIPALLPDHLYADEPSSAGDAYVDDADATSLLARLQPFIMPQRAALAENASASPMDAIYTITLVGNPPRSIQIQGDLVRLLDGAGSVLAEARAANLTVSVHSYLHEAGRYALAPRLTCPALAISFVGTDIMLVIGAAPIDSEAQWDHVPRGPHPAYEVGYAELMRLMHATGAGPRS